MAAGRRWSVVHVVVAAFALFLLYLSIPNIGPSLRAAVADGPAGWFTAERLTCIQHPGHESCTWSGRFSSDDGAIARGSVALYGADRDVLQVGERTRAVDVGRPYQVYGPGGSREWIATGLLSLAGCALLAGVGIKLLRPLGRAGSPARQE